MSIQLGVVSRLGRRGSRVLGALRAQAPEYAAALFITFSETGGTMPGRTVDSPGKQHPRSGSTRSTMGSRRKVCTVEK